MPIFDLALYGRMADPTHDSAAMLQPPGPFVPLPVADQMAKAAALLYDVEIPELTPDISEVVDQLNIIVAAIADSGLMLWASPIVYFRTECGFGTYLQDVSEHRVSDWNSFLFDTLDIEATAPWRRPIYRGGPITDYDARPGYAWRFFNHFGIDIYDASGGRGVYGLFDGFFPGKYYPDIDDTTDLGIGIISSTSFSITWDHTATVKPKIGFYLLLNGARVPGKEALVDVLDGVHTFTGLIAGTTYDVSGYLMDRYNQSSTASILSVTTLGGGAPSAPIVTYDLTDVSLGIVTLSWLPISDAVSYTFYVDGGVKQEGITVTTITKTDITPGTYTMQVSAVNAAGEGPLSTPETIIVPEPIPNAPSGLQIDEKSSTTATLSWAHIGVAAYFNIYRGGILDGSANNVQGIQPFYTFTGLSPSTEYSVEVTAVNGDDVESAKSDALSFETTPDIPLPTAPTGVTATNPYSSGFTVSWTASDASGYKLYRYEHGSSTILEVVQDVLGTSYTFTNLPPPPTELGSQQWDVRVRAYNAAGESALSDPPLLVVTTNIPECPSIIDRSTVFNGFTVTWADLSWNPDINGILVRLDGIAQTPVGAGTPVISKATISATFENIPAGTYALTVISFNELNGTHIECDALEPITPETLVISASGFLDAPTGVTVLNAYSTGFKVSWDPVANATSYKINIDSSGFSEPRVYDALVTQCDVSGLPAPISFGGTRDYVVTVVAKSGAVTSDPSESVFGTVTYVPPAVTGVTVTDLSDDGFTLNWNSVAENPNVTNIEVLVSSVSERILARNAVSTSYSGIPALSTPYTVSIRTYNSVAGTRSSVYVVEVYVPPRPLQPTGVVYDSTSPNIILNWETAQGAKYYRFVFDGSYQINGGMYVNPYFPPDPAADAQTYTFASLYPPSKLFTLGIEPYNDMGVMGPASHPLEIAAYPGPLTVRTGYITQNSIEVIWISTTENNARYTVRLYDENGNPLNTIYDEPGPTYTFTPLAISTTYKIGITPSNDYGTGTESIAPAKTLIYSGSGFTRKFFSGEPLAAGTAASTVFAGVETGTATTIEGVPRVDGWIVAYNEPEVKATWFVQFKITWSNLTQRILLGTNADDGFLVRYRETGTTPWNIICDSWKTYPGHGLGGQLRYTLPFTLEQSKTYEFQVVTCNYLGVTQCRIFALAAPTEPIVVENGTYTFAPPGTAGSVYNAGTSPYAYDSDVLDSLTLTEVNFSQYMVTP
jgi:fibronectin type 3 domain-containing protein